MILDSIDADIASLRAVISERFPEIAGESVSILSAGWDCVALDAGGKLLFKFPRNVEASARLRKEVRLLDVIRPRLRMTVPDMRLSDTPLFSWHRSIPGVHLLSSEYENLPEAARKELAEALAGFCAELHAIEPKFTEEAGASALPAWPSGEVLRRTALPLTPENFRRQAEGLTHLWDALGPDPHGNVFGHFDGHGWNMAFDHTAQRLNGIYDFGDSGIGPLHQDFIYANFISSDLTARVIHAYEVRTGKAIDRARVKLLTGVYRLVETASAANDPANIEAMVNNLTRWLQN